jgi:hypothetical protein
MVRPPAPDDLPTPTPTPAPAPGLAPGQQLLLYTPEGPLGGTFTCLHCRAQAWQPALLQHGAGCPVLAAAAPPLPGQ